MITLIIGVIAVLLEVFAVWWLWPLREGDIMNLIGFMAVHGIASLCLSAFVAAALPPHLRKPVPPVIVLLFGFSFFIPVLGLVGQIVALLVAKFLPRVVPELPYAEMPPIEFEFPPREMRERTKYSPGGLTARLKDDKTPKDLRFKSLLALSGMPPRIANPLLQDMLSDTTDEIRLVAYGMLNDQEKAINEHIHVELEKLKDSSAPEDLRLISLRRLSELYWELVYAGLVHGDVRAHAIQETDRYLDQAMRAAPDDAGLWFLKGKILLQRRDPAAEAAFRRAVANGLEESRALAFLGQIAFERRDFREVQRIFSALSEGQYAPRLRPAVKYWSGNVAA
jgi:hypothetical protein